MTANPASRAIILAWMSALASCSSGGGGGGMPPAPLPPPSPPQSFSQISNAIELGGVQAGAKYTQDVTLDVVESGTAGLTIIINPIAAGATPIFIAQANAAGIARTQSFNSTHLLAPHVLGGTNALFVAPGSNPRAESSVNYRLSHASEQERVQNYDIRPSAGGAPFAFARVLQYREDLGFLSSSIFWIYSVYGFESASAPTTGTASWQGVGLGTVGITPTGGEAYTAPVYEFLGDASLVVDFGAGTVAGDISNMTYTEDTTSLFTPADPLTSIALAGTISGNGFTGSMTADFATSPDLTGALSGKFYGLGATPVEAGGVFAGQDANYNVVGAFVVGAP
jgi:hypothetical protein